MSNFKIIGDPTPAVGKEEFYTVNQLLPTSIPITLFNRLEPNPFEKPIEWSVYVLEFGKWIKKEENNKTGDKVSYTFLQKSLDRDGIRIIAERGMHSARLDIKPHKAESPKIHSIEFLDYLGKKPTKPFAYGQTLKARIHCLHMERRTVYATLWEDDAAGAGHNKANEKNKMKTLPGTVKDGIADIDFLLDPDFSKIANASKAKGDSSEGKTHEYYVTVEFFNKKIASANTNVPNPTYSDTAAKPAPPKKQTPAQKKGPSKKQEKEKSIGEDTIDWIEDKLKIEPIILPDPIEIVNSVLKIFQPEEEEEKKGRTNCEEKFCIKKGDKSELIREINIRLAGFGGNVPTDEFTDRTEKMVKQFQRDYMKVTETGKVCGKVCGNVLKAIDEFQSKYPINFNEIKCKCGKCTGYGNENKSEEYQNTSVKERFRKYEYPGIHRSLVCGYRASLFYLEKEKHLGYKTKWIESGYRCHSHPIYIATGTTNHCGKALDIHYNILSTGQRTKKIADIEKIRLEIFNKYLGAKWDWKEGQTDIFNLESTAKNATTWIHVDVREFSQEYLTKKYFVKDIATLNGKNLIAFANELGHTKTCICNGGSNTPTTVALQNGLSQRVDPKTLKASDKLIQFIKDWEKLEKKAYNDSNNYCTIGYGHLIKKKKCEDILIPDEFKNGITEEEATKLFKLDLQEFEKAVQRDVTVKLYQREFDALLDLLFNCGANFLSTNKAPQLNKNLLDEKYEDAAKEFLDIENKKRREQNYEIFINGNYDSTH